MNGERKGRLLMNFKPKGLFGINQSLLTVCPEPRLAIIDPTNICNLKCPLCPTGSGNLDYPPKHMTIELFKIIIAKLPFVKQISLFNWGEPFLCPDIIPIIQHAKSLGKDVLIHSNFSLNMNDDFMDQIVESGLDGLVLSIDGFSKDAYSAYRRGGRIEVVMANLERIVHIREYKGHGPHIIWKFIINNFNVHEILMAKEYAKKLGIGFVVDKMGLGDDLVDAILKDNLDDRIEYWVGNVPEELKAYPRSKPSEPCSSLINYIFINPDGLVSPCCWTSSRSSTFGDLAHQSFDNIWNGPKYQHSRSLFYKMKTSSLDKTESICDNCNLFKKWNFL
jgi:radical SAM protein with 4Fe4S-binding SPASM domain